MESFLFLFSGIIGIITLVLMMRSYYSNPFSNFYLILVIGILSFRHIIHGSYYLNLQTVFKADSGLYSILYLIIVPSFYLYYKHLIFPKINYDLKDLKHLSFIVFLFLINTIKALDNSILFYFGKYTNLLYVAIFILFYLTLIFNLLKSEIWGEKELLLNDKHFSLVKNWTMYLFIINVFNSIVVIISIYSELSTGANPSGKTLSVFILLCWLFVFFKILTSPEILFGLPILNKTLLNFVAVLPEKDEVIEDVNTNEDTNTTNWILETDSVKNSQDLRLQENIREHILSYIKEVEKLSSEKFIFRNPKTTQSDIAEALGVPTSHIVYLFKYHSITSFSEYRMSSRIQDAITLIKNGFLNSETLESLAYTTGFASYNPFFIAFKKITYYSPHDYAKAIKG